MNPKPTTPIVSDHPDGHSVEWPGYKRAFALFSVQGSKIVVTDIFRDPGQPKGSAGQMLADAFRAKGICRPGQVRIAKIIDTQPTKAQMDKGQAPSETVLGQVLIALGDAFGLRVTAWSHGEDRLGKPWIEASYG